MFIKLNDQVVNANSIVEVSKPTQVGIDWWITTSLDLSKSRKDTINTVYKTEADATSAYNRLVEQLCSDKV